MKQERLDAQIEHILQIECTHRAQSEGKKTACLLYPQISQKAVLLQKKRKERMQNLLMALCAFVFALLCVCVMLSTWVYGFGKAALSMLYGIGGFGGLLILLTPILLTYQKRAKGEEQ